MLRRAIAFSGVLALAAAYSIQPAETQATRPGAPKPAPGEGGPARVALYEGARLIAGDGSAPIEKSAFLVENGTIRRVGRSGGVAAPLVRSVSTSPARR